MNWEMFKSMESQLRELRNVHKEYQILQKRIASFQTSRTHSAMVLLMLYHQLKI